LLGWPRPQQTFGQCHTPPSASQERFRSLSVTRGTKKWCKRPRFTVLWLNEQCGGTTLSLYRKGNGTALYQWEKDGADEGTIVPDRDRVWLCSKREKKNKPRGERSVFEASSPPECACAFHCVKRLTHTRIKHML